MFADLGWLVLTTLVYGLAIAYCVAVIPAMVLMAWRRHWAYFGAGFVTFGLAWILGAFQVLEISKRTVAIGIALVFLVGLFAARPALLIGVDGKDLQNSVDRLFTENKRCQEAGDDWICWSYDDQISGDRRYRTDVNWMGCWEATAIRNKGEGNWAIEDPETSGCITLIDLP
ncbi:MAG: hypothetical protein J0H66_04920 [Solirubrobacterales bacterium]|nr:hypothetical protein [Solirubrobacterales bacterium]OJU94580.1 MAG: hypothetical protein BGO23_04075 [Solirubrobacterales bacterium 67-14]